VSLKFGTDGIRGVANVELTPELALAFGRAAARVLGGDRWLIGRDTRRSGPSLAAALAAGLASEGAHVVDLGVVPTPGVAYLAGLHQTPAAMISASHNHFADNGIKVFAAGGHKLTDAVEEAIESELAAIGAETGGSVPRPQGAAVGDVLADHGSVARYRDHLAEEVLEGRGLDGLRVVLDSANGAASGIADDVFARLGTKVVSLHDAPDGININAGCGSTHPEDLQAAVLAEGADVGLAFDGDADRVLAVDAKGNLVDGDHLIAVCTIDLHRRHLLANDTVVVTVMSNLGFHHGMAAHDIGVVTTDVGDRYVLEALDAGGHVLGGEQSGHVIFRRLAATGDGMLTGLCLLDVMARTGTPLAELAGAAMTQLPQVLVNVRTPRRDPEVAGKLEPQLAAARDRLGERGRVLLRASGTEPVIRVMVEAPTAAEAGEVAEGLAEAVRDRSA